ncbi:MAG: hypothetical protein KDA79_23835 [Planctomycetaceae bacterium]|nr:hypothetical protein [Planctomycetaceae bacterium]
MPLSRESLERQLSRAEADRAQRIAQLDEQGVPEASRRRDPLWRRCNAACRKLRTRLTAVTAKEELASGKTEEAGEPVEA